MKKCENEAVVKDNVKSKKKIAAIVGGAVASAAALVGIGTLLKKKKDKNIKEEK